MRPDISELPIRSRARLGRERILALIREAAITEFGLHGFKGASTQEIAERAGLTKPQLQHYIKGKDELYKELLFAVLRGWSEAFAFDASSADPRRVLSHYIHKKLAYALDNPGLSRIFTNELLGGGPNLQRSWNHTTLVAMKANRGFTYIQSGFEPARHVEQVKALERLLAGEVLMHLEFLRTKDGAFNCSGLQLILFTSEARLNEIMQVYRDHGVTINNPHVFILEDGKQGPLNPAVIEMKRRFDPQGLLNPGKMRSWTALPAD